MISRSGFEARAAQDDSLSGWRFCDVQGKDGGTELCRSFRFRDFRRAFGFMSEVALLAERHDHHPVWTNSWNRVEVALCSFDAGHRVTERDVAMAAEMNRIARAVEEAAAPGWPVG